MIKVILMHNGISVIGDQIENDHVRLLRIKDPLIFTYRKDENDDWAMFFQSMDIVAKPREARIAAMALFDANKDQVRQYKDACDTIFKTEKTNG